MLKSNSQKGVLNFVLQKIFSLNNERSGQATRKVITILGFQIKIKKSNKKQLKKIKSQIIKPKSVLLIEANECHNETLPSFAKYFTDLGFNVDILITNKMYHEKVFSRVDKKYYNNIFYLYVNEIQAFLSSEKPSEYEYIFINSNRLYYNDDRINPIKFFDFFKHITSSQNGFIILEHHLEYLKEMRVFEQKLLQLPNFNNGALFCNANYFGEIQNHTKNKITNFIAIGEFKDFRRNVSLLYNAIDELAQNNVQDFKITILSRKFTHIIPQKIKKYIDVKLNLPFDSLYNEIEKADFFLTCLDPENPKHDRYVKNGTSGSFQLIYGFNIPCLLENKFASKHFFNSENSIIYHENKNFVKALHKCIKMNNADYQKMKTHLEDTTDLIRKMSLENLKKSVANKPYKIVSLGCDCLPRTYTVNTNIKAKKSQGECSMPFDLCVTPTLALCEILENKFRDYLKSLRYSKKLNCWVNSKYHIRYNHDTDCKNSIRGKKAIIKRLKSRIANFKTILNYGGIVYFIINNPSNTTLTNNIYSQIQILRKNKPFKFIVLDIDAKLCSSDLIPNIIVFNDKHPFLSADAWWKEENKKLNSEYQEKVSSFLLNLIEKDSREQVYEK